MNLFGKLLSSLIMPFSGTACEMTFNIVRKTVCEIICAVFYEDVFELACATNGANANAVTCEFTD